MESSLFHFVSPIVIDHSWKYQNFTQKKTVPIVIVYTTVIEIDTKILICMFWTQIVCENPVLEKILKHWYRGIFVLGREANSPIDPTYSPSFPCHFDKKMNLF